VRDPPEDLLVRAPRERRPERQELLSTVISPPAFNFSFYLANVFTREESTILVSGDLV
jgi:hypothetical protein